MFAQQWTFFMLLLESYGYFYSFMVISNSFIGSLISASISIIVAWLSLSYHGDMIYSFLCLAALNNVPD
jgi:hypothetical protein